MMIMLCAAPYSFEDWVNIEDFGCEEEKWLRGFLELPHGIPSHDILSDVMGASTARRLRVPLGSGCSRACRRRRGSMLRLMAKAWQPRRAVASRAPDERSRWRR